MKAKSDLPYCLLIQKDASNILDYTENMSEDDFVKSNITYDVCILNFINTGEQMKSLSNVFKEKFSHIPYRKIIGLRNIAAHTYEGLEPFRLYKTIREDIPSLQEQFSGILKSNDLA